MCIFVICTDPSETISMRGRQVVLEGCYQLFINSSLNSFCGQLKKIFYIKICVISLTIYKLWLCTKQRHFRVFPIWAGMQTSYRDFVICMGIIAFRFKNHSRHIKTAGLHKSQASLFCTMTPIILASQCRSLFVFFIRWKEFFHFQT